MSSTITNMVPLSASGEPDPGIVQDYKARLQVLGILPGANGQVHPNDPAPHRMVVSERGRDRDARHSRPCIDS